MFNCTCTCMCTIVWGLMCICTCPLHPLIPLTPTHPPHPLIPSRLLIPLTPTHPPRVSSEPVLSTHITDQMENIVDIREHDVPYHIRVAIDNKLNVGHWYRVRGHGNDPPEILPIADEPDRPVSCCKIPALLSNKSH